MAMARQSFPDTGEIPMAAALDEGTWRTVRVRGPEGAVDAALPAGASVAEVVDELAGRLLPGAPLVRGADGRPWYLHRTGSAPLPPGVTLDAAGVRDGDVLHLGPWPMPRPAQAVDDGLVALAEGAERVARWTPRRVGVLVAGVLVVVAGVGAGLSLLLPGGPLVPLAIAGMLLGLAALARRARGAVGPGAGSAVVGPGVGSGVVGPGAGSGVVGRSDRGPDDDRGAPRSSGDLPSLGAALASLPAWAIAGVAGGLAAGTGLPAVLTLAGSGLAVGAGLAWLVVADRGPWWAAAGTLGTAVCLPGALVAGGLATAPRAVSVVLVLWLVALLAVPWLVTRNRTWTDPTLDAEDLVEHAEQTRRTIDATALASGAAAAVGLALLAWWAARGDVGGMVLGLVSAVSLAAALRARRSVFVAESGSALGAGLVGLAGVGGALAWAGGPAARTTVVVVVVLLAGVLVALAGALRAAGTGDDGVVAWWHRPRTQRLLGWLETTAAVAVLPLLAGVLGVYAAASDAGARL